MQIKAGAHLRHGKALTSFGATLPSPQAVDEMIQGHEGERCRGMVDTIVSGGQTGVDRAALDVALEQGIPCGGWCPPGRAAEDGSIPGRYPLTETPEGAGPEAPGVPNSQRTAWNVRDSDGTLVLTRGELDGGTALTIRLAGQHGKPCLVVDLAGQPRAADVRNWVQAQGIRVLNVAGPRERSSPGIYHEAARFLRELLG
jgi:hypothetical protein